MHYTSFFKPHGLPIGINKPVRKTKLFLLSVCLAGTDVATEMHTTEPANVINAFLLNGVEVTKVSIKPA